jgi:hypothetical protein
LLFVFSLSLTGLASAETLRGKGWLHAEGSGVAALNLSGEIEIIGHGVGAVYIYGHEALHVSGSGKGTDLPGGGVLFRGYSGTIKVVGEDMRIRMIGGKIDFTAHGKGVVHLRGRGHYETANLSGDWNDKGVELEVVEE